MSIHRSLAPRGALKRSRNVMTRKERCEILKAAGKWNEEESSLFGLPKVRTQFKVAKKKAVKKEAAEGAAAPGAAAPAGAAAAKGAAPAGAKGATPAGGKAAAAPAAKAGDKKAPAKK
ncbi:MAG: small basic protein [Planctomycetota bacterium]